MALSLLISVGGASVACGDSGARPGNVVALIPGLTLAEHDTVLSHWLPLEPYAPYLLREGGNARRLARVANMAVVSPSGAWITIETSRPDTSADGGFHRDVELLDTLGNRFATFYDVVHATWSSDGERLAVVRGRYPGEAEVPVTQQVEVWNLRTGERRAFEQRPYAAEWLGQDSLLLDFYREIRVLDLRTGGSSASSFHARIVSPDHQFSLSDDAESDGPRVWDESRGLDITPELRRMIGGARIRPLPGPFWVTHPTRGALLCVPTCLYRGELGPGGGDSISCWTYLIDVPSRTVLKRIPGRALAPSANHDSGVFLRNDKVQFVNLTN